MRAQFLHTLTLRSKIQLFFLFTLFFLNSACSSLPIDPLRISSSNDHEHSSEAEIQNHTEETQTESTDDTSMDSIPSSLIDERTEPTIESTPTQTELTEASDQNLESPLSNTETPTDNPIVDSSLETTPIVEETPITTSEPSVEFVIDNTIPDSTQTETLLNLNSPDYSALLVEALPVDDVELKIASPFGPRLQSGQGNRYDFHRGIDILGERGDTIRAVSDGVIYKVYDEGSSAYPDSGRVVIVKHDVVNTFIFQGSVITSYYSLYMHLDSFSPKAQEVLDSGLSQPVEAGEWLGGMGDSGITEMVHLHFEIRLQTTCSLAYQTANPTKTCAQYEFDPHINPVDFFIDPNLDESNYHLELTHETSNLNISAFADRPAFNIDGITIEIYSDESQSELLFEKTLSYNSRLGFDATSTENLDNPELDSILISPHTLGISAEQYQIDFTVYLQDFPTAHFAKVLLFNTQEMVQEKTLVF